MLLRLRRPRAGSWQRLQREVQSTGAATTRRDSKLRRYELSNLESDRHMLINRSGTPWHCGPGISLLTTVRFAGITSWTPVCWVTHLCVTLLLTSLRYRMSSQPRSRYHRRVHRRLGHLQPRFPLSLHIEMAEDTSSLPARQPRLGVSKVWSVDVS